MPLLLVAFRPGDAESSGGFAHDVGGDVTLALAYDGESEPIGAAKVLRLGDAPVDALASGLAAVAKEFDRIAAPTSMQAKDVLARLAGLLDAPMVSEAIAMSAPDTFERPIYAGALIETVQVAGSPVVITFRPANFPGEASLSANGPEEPVALPASGITVVTRSERDSARPDLTQAKTVVSGGRPLKDAETFERVVGGFADTLGGAVGATRAAVDSGIASNELQVGQTGKIVAPDLYIAAGISGSTQHMAGIKDSKIIVAINKDADAPIFEVADYGLVGDLYDVLPELDRLVKERGNR